MDAWAIKIGGSLYGSQYLVKWLQAISEQSKKKLIIIPGGGPFADQVRQADEKYNLDQVNTHNMAIMAMQQYGALLASLCPSIVTANSKDKIHLAWKKSKAVVWEPYEMLRDECELEKSWDITSDSITIWLANKLDLENVLLVKSSNHVLENKGLDELTISNCVDPGFKELVRQAGINLHILHKSQVKEFERLII